MKFSSGHGYAHPKSKKIIQRKASVKIFKKFPKTVQVAEKRKSQRQHHPRYTTQTHTHTHTNTDTYTHHTHKEVKQNKKRTCIYFPSIKIYQSLKVPLRFLKSSHLDKNQRNATKTYQPLNRQQQFLQLLCNVLYIVSSY